MGTLGWKQLNRAVLARQLLLERSTLPLHRVVERMAGVQAQYIPSAYVGLWSRSDGFERSALTSALERGSIIQGTLIRGTIHLVSRADYWPIAGAVRENLQDWWLRVTRSGRTRDEMLDLSGRLRHLLGDGPKKRKDLIAELAIDTETWNGVGYWVELVRVPPSGTWDARRADLYALATEWVGPDTSNPSSAADHLVRRYLTGFGPASREAIKAFTGLNLTDVDDAIERLKVRYFDDLVDVPGAPLPDADTPAPVRFLGTWDATLLVHARRSQILPEEFRDRIFHTRAPHSFNTFLVDGQVRGVWREEGREIAVEPFEPIPRRFRKDLEDEAEGLTALFA